MAHSPTPPLCAADTIARGVLQKAGLEGAFCQLLDIQGAGAEGGTSAAALTSWLAALELAVCS